MTVVAFDRLEDVPASKGALIDGSIVACLPLIPRGVAANNRSFESGDCFDDGVGSCIAMEDSLKLGFVSLQCI